MIAKSARQMMRQNQRLARQRATRHPAGCVAPCSGHVLPGIGERLHLLETLATTLTNASTPDDVARIVLEEGFRPFGAISGRLVLLDDEAGHLNTIARIGIEPAPHGDTDLPMNAHDPCVYCVRMGAPLWFESVDLYLQRYPELAGEIHDPVPTAMAALPLTISGHSIGAVLLGFPHAAYLDPNETAFLLLVAGYGAQALDRARLATQQQRIRQNAEQMRDRSIDVIESITDAFITLDEDLRYTYANEKAQELLGQPEYDLLGHRFGDIFPEPVASTFVRNARRAIDEQATIVFEAHDPRRDSWFTVHLYPSPDGVTCYLQDVTRQKQAEQTLADSLTRTTDLYEISRRIGLVHTTSDVLQALLGSRWLAEVNAEALLIFDRPWEDAPPTRIEVDAVWRADDGPGPAQRLWDILNPSTLGLLFQRDTPVQIADVSAHPRLRAPIRDVLEQAALRSLLFFPLIASGRWYGVLMLGSKNPQGWSPEATRHIQGLIDQAAIAIDNIRHLNAETHAREDAERANQQKLRFLGIVSHELRTPLTSIKGFATTLLADDVVFAPERQRDFLRVIDQEADKLTDLVEQLLDLSRIEAGRLSIHAKPTTVEDILETANVQLNTLAAQHQLVIELPALPLVQADPYRIAQVIVNLVGNAARFAPLQSAITIAARQTDDHVIVTVGDEGPGIPPEARTVVFEAFRQAEPDAPYHKGAGLGLAICKGLVEAHGGRIWIDDTERGTRLAFTLPTAPPAAE